MVRFEEYLPEGWTRGNSDYCRVSDDAYNHSDLFYKGVLVANATTKWMTVKLPGKKVAVSVHMMYVTHYYTKDPAIIKRIADVLEDTKARLAVAQHAEDLVEKAHREIIDQKWAEERAKEAATKAAAIENVFGDLPREREEPKRGVLAVAKHIRRWLAPIRYS